MSYPLMLCSSLTEDEFKAMDKSKYIGELKEDGERIMVIKLGNQISLMNRRGVNKASVYPEITQAIKDLPYDIVTFDGEVITPNGCFNNLQERSLVRDVDKIAQRIITNPVIYRIFDMLRLEDKNLAMDPLMKRKENLDRLGLKGVLQSVPYFIGEDILTLWDDVKSKNQEGIVIKYRDSLWVGKRSKAWIKIKFWHESELEFDKYEINNAGVKVSNGLDEVQVQGVGRAVWIKGQIDMGLKVKVVVQYLTRDARSGKMRFPSCREVIGVKL